MQKKFIVKTPFGIGVATSEEDLKELLESIGLGGAEQEESDTPCDCPRCQARAAAQGDAFPEELSKKMDAVAEKLLREEGPELSFGQYVHRFMSELADEMSATGEDAGDERSESQQGTPIEDILSMIFGEPVDSSEQAPAPEKITLEKIATISSLSDLAQVRDDLSRESYELMNEMARMTDRSEEVAELIEAADARKAVITAGNAGEARAMVREQFTALETVLNDASMKTGIPDEVFKEVARLKEKFSL